MLEIMKASAGSGKTFRLAGKYISILLNSADRYAYRHILAVTFTNKATDEMKSRILKELHVLSTEPQRSPYRDAYVPSVFPSDDELKRKAENVLHDILHDYSAFAVSTIDRFFQQTLKAFSREIGQFASYQVELDKDSLVAESVDRILDSLTEEDGTLLSWLTTNVLEQIEQGGKYSLDANLLEMAKRLKSPQRKEMMEKLGISKEEICSKEQLLNVRNACRDIMTEFRNEVRAKARAALDVIEQAGVNTSDSNRGFMNCLYDYAGLDDCSAIAAPTASFMTKAADSSQWFSKTKAKTLLPLVSPFLEAPLEDFCSLFGQKYAVYNTAEILDGQLYGLGVAGELERTFMEIMKEKNVLCIDDSNTILRDIIDGSDAPFVYEKTGVRYEHFLLDEFQDTARVQWLNFSPLLHNSDSQGGENLIVGDVKQSIYRWRGSDWNLLNETIPSEFAGHKQTVLDTNYRSLSNIVGFNNGFFAQAAAVLDRMDGYESGGPMSEIYADVEQVTAQSDKPSGSVSLTFCEKDMQLEKVLDAVREAVSAGARLSEIAVLVRSNAVGESIATYLIDNGITVITDDSLRVKSSITVRRLVSLMSFVDNPQDTVNAYLSESLDIALPQGCLSLSDMAEHLLRGLKKSDAEGRWKGESLHIQSFMDHLQDYVNSNGNSLRGFLKYWEGENPSISSPSSGDSVRVMTIHKSKGLAFPYVIIPYAENISMYKPGSMWCVPDLDGTPLSGVADGVYDVCLSRSSESTLFADDYRKENFLQHVDNMNVLYVAMTRPVSGMHIIARTPSAKCRKAVEDGDVSSFTDFSQLLYWYASSSVLLHSCEADGTERFDVGEMVDFASLRKEERRADETFDIPGGDVWPSIPLNPAALDPETDVRERGRLKFSAESVDFFSHEGEAGISASNRIRGVVLHDILAEVKSPADLEGAVEAAVSAGEITSEEAVAVKELLEKRISQEASRGWFPEGGASVLAEADVIDVDGRMFRPDRVVISGDKVQIVDYKFGEHRQSYVRQLRRYGDIWRRMGYSSVSAYLWYVQDGEVVEVYNDDTLL